MTLLFDTNAFTEKPIDVGDTVEDSMHQRGFVMAISTIGKTSIAIVEYGDRWVERNLDKLTRV